MNIKLLKLAMDADPRLTPEIKETLLKETQSAFDFHEHMKSTLDINDQEAESLSKSFFQARMKDGTLEELHDIFLELASYYKFNEGQKFADSMITLLKMTGVE